MEIYVIEFPVYYAFSNLISYIIGRITRNLITFLALIFAHSSRYIFTLYHASDIKQREKPLAILISV